VTDVELYQFTESSCSFLAVFSLLRQNIPNIWQVIDVGLPRTE